MEAKTEEEGNYDPPLTGQRTLGVLNPNLGSVLGQPKQQHVPQRCILNLLFTV